MSDIVIEDTADYQVIRTPSAAGHADRFVWKPGAQGGVRETVDADLRQKARAALTANATYLALATPTNAQNAAQVQRLTRECSGLIRLLIGADLLVESTDV